MLRHGPSIALWSMTPTEDGVCCGEKRATIFWGGCWKGIWMKRCRFSRIQPLVDKSWSAYIPIQCAMFHISRLTLCDKNKPGPSPLSCILLSVTKPVCGAELKMLFFCKVAIVWILDIFFSMILFTPYVNLLSSLLLKEATFNYMSHWIP